MIANGSENCRLRYLVRDRQMQADVPRKAEFPVFQINEASRDRYGVSVPRYLGLMVTGVHQGDVSHVTRETDGLVITLCGDYEL